MKDRRILLVNPNTDRKVTVWLAEEAWRVAGPGVTIEAVNAASGLAAIQTPDEVERAGRSVLEAISARPGIDAAVIAAFGDPGLEQARASCVVPVIGLGEAGLRAAALGGRRFCVVTLGAAMQGAIRDRITELGLERQCAGVTILPISIAEIIAERDRHRAVIVTAVRACFERENAQAVLLGGAPFAGLARALSDELSQTVLDGVEASIRRA